MSNTVAVDEEVRRQNNYWIARRNKWRERYATIAGEIKYYKELYACFPNMHNATVLSSFKTIAAIMMAERDIISSGLKVTAYRYC
jgi:hypothetical protein